MERRLLLPDFMSSENEKNTVSAKRPYSVAWAVFLTGKSIFSAISSCRAQDIRLNPGTKTDAQTFPTQWLIFADSSAGLDDMAKIKIKHDMARTMDILL